MTRGTIHNEPQTSDDQRATANRFWCETLRWRAEKPTRVIAVLFILALACAGATDGAYAHAASPGNDDTPLVAGAIAELQASEATSIALDKTSVQIEVGDEALLNVTVAPDEADPVLVWKVDDESVAPVNDKREVYGEKAVRIDGKCEGVTTVRVFTRGNLSAECRVNVRKRGAADYEKFVRAASELISQNYGDPSAAAEDEYASARLIVKDRGMPASLDEFDVVGSARDAGSCISIVQFRTRDEANLAAKALGENSDVEWVEGDACITAAGELSSGSDGQASSADASASSGEPISAEAWDTYYYGDTVAEQASSTPLLRGNSLGQSGDACFGRCGEMAGPVLQLVGRR